MTPAPERKDFRPDAQAISVCLGADLRLAFSTPEGIYFGTERAVSLKKARALGLSWSPDGTRVAYRLAEPRSIAWADLAGERGRVAGVAYAWMPDGGGLVIVDPPRMLVGQHSLATNETKRLAKIDDDGSPDLPPRLAVSPDGQSIVYTCRRAKDAVSEVWLIEGGNTVALNKVSTADVRLLPFWAPGSDALGLHVVHPAKCRSVLLVRRGNDESLLYRSDLPDAAETPAWSPTGRTIALMRTTAPRHSYTRTGPPQLTLLDAASGALTPLSGPAEITGTPRWIDDRRLVVDGGPSAHLFTFAEPV